MASIVRNKHQNRVSLSHISLCQITVYLENSRLKSKPKESMIKMLRNRHWIHNQHNTWNSWAKFYLIWRIINFGSKFTQKLLKGGALRQRNQGITAFCGVLCRFIFYSRCVGDSQWWGSLTIGPTGSKAKRLLSVNHTTKTIHHHHHHHYHQVISVICWVLLGDFS